MRGALIRYRYYSLSICVLLIIDAHFTFGDGRMGANLGTQLAAQSMIKVVTVYRSVYAGFPHRAGYAKVCAGFACLTYQTMRNQGLLPNLAGCVTIIQCSYLSTSIDF